MTNRSVVVTGNRIITSNHGLDHKYAIWLAEDLHANDGFRTQVVRLPRRLFRTSLRYYRNTLMLQHGAQPSQVL